MKSAVNILTDFYEARQWEHLAPVPDIPFSCKPLRKQDYHIIRTYAKIHLKNPICRGEWHSPSEEELILLPPNHQPLLISQ
ncbi:MAG: hypothetical protein F6K23_21730 [Okeania sp. SIO2C9]|uniref:hypothetical protein n=1 Tax=Okeania sp. SIO2C9 TaxID=2607791 RepID=UPI0013BEE9A5|nr:hypothetical protein [Okeania sp. SIO2C9]NEQ75439.1 hypothetical protein [Okeania sp. SIO2C9]